MRSAGFRVGAEAEGPEFRSCTITLGPQPPQQVLEAGLCREGAKQALTAAKLDWIGLTHPGIL